MFPAQQQQKHSRSRSKASKQQPSSIFTAPGSLAFTKRLDPTSAPARIPLPASPCRGRSRPRNIAGADHAIQQEPSTQYSGSSPRNTAGAASSASPSAPRRATDVPQPPSAKASRCGSFLPADASHDWQHTAHVASVSHSPARQAGRSAPGNGKKRAAAADAQPAATSKPVAKKGRVRPKQKHSLDHFSGAGPSLYNPQPPSPLFFSNSPRPRPQLPPRFSSAEAAATMLSKARSEEAHVKTVSLARGTLGNTRNPASEPARRSVDRSSAAQSHSPEGGAAMKGSSMEEALSSIGMIELLEQDERPTFIVDLSVSSNYGPEPLGFVFANSSLRAYNGLLELVGGLSADDSAGQKAFLQFKAWLLSATINGESLNVCLPSFRFAGMQWSCSTLRKRLRLISGTFPATEPARATTSGDVPSASIPAPSTTPLLSSGSRAMEPADYFGDAAPPPPPLTAHSGASNSAISEAVPTIELHGSSTLEPHSSTTLTNGDIPTNNKTTFTAGKEVPLATPSPRLPLQPRASSDYEMEWFGRNLAPEPNGFFDWTRLPITDSMPRHIRFARSIHWSATSLGPIEFWSSDLRQMCNLIMASPHPAAMYWGEDLVAIYNEAFILLAGQKHPRLMGQSYRDAWSEIWDDVKDVFANAKHTGEATMKDDDCLFLKRHNFLEETYFSWSIIPMVGGDGSVMGLYTPAFEKTRRKIAERRMLTLREIGERTAAARDVKAFWSQVVGSFEFNEYDSPCLLLYSVSDEADSDCGSIHSNSVFSTRQCILEGALGVPEGHEAAPGTIELKSGMAGFGPAFREAMKTDKPVLLEVGSRDLPESLLAGMEWRGFGDAVRAVVVCPIHPTTGESILGFLVLGVNPRRPYDDDYSLFVQLLSRQLATSLASVVLFEEEIRRGQKAAKLAALDRIQLSEQLAARTQEAIESETKFTRMAEFAPVGMFIADSEGRITYCNDMWYEITRVPRGGSSAGPDRWVEAIKNEDQQLVRNLWTELVENTKAQTAEFRFKAPWEDRNGTRSDTWVLFSAYPERYESGSLKSVFGSITNISQQKWAEGIQTRKMEEAVEMKRQQENFIDITSHEMRNPLSAILQCADEISGSMNECRARGEQSMGDELVASTLDAAQTIALCAQHQKRIVDDVLTLSKLDSALLLVTPVDAQPLTVVQRALKMHEGELQTADIQMRFVVDQSYRELAIDWVRFDPSRVLQVLINLTTNAIKFTTTERKRTITVTVAASRAPPNSSSNKPVSYFATRSQREKEAFVQDGEWGEGEVVYIHFAVKDTGRGLNAEETKLLFLRFSQASPRTHVQYGGSGLGLFISRELTELQGGEIGVDSEAGSGSTFAFYIAARRSTAPEQHGAADQPTPAKPRPGPRKKVLIVEDNLVNQRVLQKQLRKLGCDVSVANHGGEALERLRHSTYWADDEADGTVARQPLSIVLMDQEMPIMDGLACTRRIRELEREGRLVAHVPIIAVTANARVEQVQSALDAGMDDVVAKPFRIPELVPKMEMLMRRYPEPAAQ